MFSGCFVFGVSLESSSRYNCGGNSRNTADWPVIGRRCSGLSFRFVVVFFVFVARLVVFCFCVCCFHLLCFPPPDFSHFLFMCFPPPTYVAFFTCFMRLQLMTTEGNAWLYKNKDHGMMSAAASLGTILLWNVEEGLTQVRRFLGVRGEGGSEERRKGEKEGQRWTRGVRINERAGFIGNGSVLARKPDVLHLFFSATRFERN